MFEIIYHKLANGDKPVKLFIDGLESKLKVKNDVLGKAIERIRLQTKRALF